MREQGKGLRSGGGNWDTKAILKARQEPLMLEEGRRWNEGRSNRRKEGGK